MADEGTGVALVTGASSGIGRSLAAELVRRGHDVVVVAEDDAVTSTDGFERAPVLAVQVDLADPAGVDELHARVLELARPVDVLALNAGIGTNGAFVDTPVASSLRVVDLDVRSVVHLAGLLVPAMARRRTGHVLVTSSIAAAMPGPYMATYNASKAFLYSFAQALRAELVDSGVHVMALQPGPTDTEFFERAGMEDTVLGRSKKDDPDDVARQGLDALFAGADHLVAGGFRNRVQVAAAKVLPDTVVAAGHARLAEPRSSE